MQGAAPNPACTIQELSRAMRKNPTQAEKKLWQELRGKKLGFEFRQKFVIDSKYIEDFVCLEKRLIIECEEDNTQSPLGKGGKERKTPPLTVCIWGGASSARGGGIKE